MNPSNAAFRGGVVIWRSSRRTRAIHDAWHRASRRAFRLYPGNHINRDEFANSRLMHRNGWHRYSITSSTRASTIGGIVRPHPRGSQELEFSRLFDRKVGRLGTLCGPAIHIGFSAEIGQQPTVVGKLSPRACRYSVVSNCWRSCRACRKISPRAQRN